MPKATLPPGKALLSVKVYQDDMEIINRVKRETPPKESAPSTAEVIGYALRGTYKASKPGAWARIKAARDVIIDPS